MVQKTFLLLKWLCLCMIAPVFAQQLSFSQYHMAPLNLNPALAAYAPEVQAILHYRDQRYLGGYKFSSSQLSVIHPLHIRQKHAGGVAVSVLDDRSGGVNWYRLQHISASVATKISLDSRNYLSFGAQSLYQIKRIGSEGVTTGSQFERGVGYDPTLATQENIPFWKTDYLSINLGMHWHMEDRYGNTAVYTGLSFSDINKPSDSFFDDSNVIPSTLKIYSGIRLYQQRQLRIFPELLYSHFGGANSLNIGSRFSFALEHSFFGKDIGPTLDIIPRYSVNRSASLAVQWRQEQFTVGLSYDTDASANTSANPLQNTFEIVLAWHKPVNPRQKNRNKKKKQRSEKEVVSKQTLIAFLEPLPPDTHGVDSMQYPMVKREYPNDPVMQGSVLMGRMVRSIEFGFNQSTLGAESQQQLSFLETYLKHHPEVKIQLSGHTDNVGSETVNLWVAQKRAESVKAYLVQQGINPKRIVVKAIGEAQPLYTNTSEVLRAKNRRVAIDFLSPKK